MNEPFHPAMNAEEFAATVSIWLSKLPKASLANIENAFRSLETASSAGHPIVSELNELYGAVYERDEAGMSVNRALEECMELYPNARPSWKKEHTDAKHDFETLKKNYYRYRKKIRSGLNPENRHSENKFSEFLLYKQWQMTGAMFVNFKKSTRIKICNFLNGLKRNSNTE